MNESVDEIVGQLEVTIIFKVDVHSLNDFDAYDLEQAARHLQIWYQSGEADIVGDFTSDTGATHSVKVVHND